MDQLFQVGDPVFWPTRDGWHTGVVVRLAAHTIPVQTLAGRTQPASSLRLTIRDTDTGRILSRDIRGCAGRHPGPFVQPGQQEP